MNIRYEDIKRAVDRLFVNFSGREATRLVLVNKETDVGRPDLGGWCREAVVDTLCDSLGIAHPQDKVELLKKQHRKAIRVLRKISEAAGASSDEERFGELVTECLDEVHGVLDDAKSSRLTRMVSYTRKVK